MKVSSIRHPLESLGVVRIQRGAIRVEKLSSRTKPAVAFPHRHDFYQLLWMEKGKGHHEIDFVNHTVQPGQFYVMKPGQVHEWKFAGAAEGTIVEFSSESLQDPRVGFSLESALMQLPDMIPIKKSESSDMQPGLRMMLQEFQQQKAGNEQILESYLRILILNLMRNAQTTSEKVEDAEGLVSKFQNLVEEHFRQQHGLEYYSEKLGLSPRALTMRTTRQLEKSGRDVIFERLLLEAKRLLAYTENSISSVGYDLGFEDANHFSRFFKQQYGKTAQEFRRTQRFKV